MPLRTSIIWRPWKLLRSVGSGDDLGYAESYAGSTGEGTGTTGGDTDLEYWTPTSLVPNSNSNNTQFHISKSTSTSTMVLVIILIRQGRLGLLRLRLVRIRDRCVVEPAFSFVFSSASRSRSGKWIFQSSCPLLTYLAISYWTPYGIFFPSGMPCNNIIGDFQSIRITKRRYEYAAYKRYGGIGILNQF
jgi:hypothetical protein